MSSSRHRFGLLSQLTSAVDSCHRINCDHKAGGCMVAPELRFESPVQKINLFRQTLSSSAEFQANNHPLQEIMAIPSPDQNHPVFQAVCSFPSALPVAQTGLPSHHIMDFISCNEFGPAVLSSAISRTSLNPLRKGCFSEAVAPILLGAHCWPYGRS